MANFKINDVVQRKQYTATSGQTAFTIPFPFLEDSDIVAYQDSTLLVLTTDYTLSGAGTASGGTLTLVSGATTGDIITIIGSTPIDRTSIYSSTVSSLTGSDLNNDFNREIIMLKQVETIQDYLQLQYKPYAEVSQSISVTKDRWLPVLGASQIWQKDSGDTEIVATTIPNYPVGSNNGNFDTDDLLVRVDTSLGNNLSQTGASIDDSDNLTLPGTITASGLTYPSSDGAAGQVMQTDGAGTISFSNAGDGDVDGPASATDNAYARFDTTSGKLIQNSLTIEDDSGNVTFAGNVTLNSDPTSNLQAATKQYVDALLAGLEFKDSVVAASTASLTASYDNGTSGVGATLTNTGTLAQLELDGITISTGDRVLIKDQSTDSQNGIYAVTEEGDGSTAWVLTRATDHDEPSEMTSGVFVVADQGVTQELTSWVQTSTITTVGTDSVTFTQIGLAGSTAPNTRTITQSSHGFAVGDWLYLNSTTYTKGIATSEATAEIIGVVSSVVDTDNFVLQVSDFVSGLSGLTAGTVYFLSETTAGEITATPPSSETEVVKPLLVAISSTSGVITNYRGELITAASLQAYDMAFIAGFDSTMTKEDVAVQTYGELVVARTGSFTGETGYADTAPTGADLILDIEKNGTSIYTTRPEFAATNQTLTAGTLKTDGTEDFVSGDRITFKITQVGSTEPGEGIRFTAKATTALI